jgi:hypothetical protein
VQETILLQPFQDRLPANLSELFERCGFQRRENTMANQQQRLLAVVWLIGIYAILIGIMYIVVYFQLR